MLLYKINGKSNKASVFYDDIFYLSKPIKQFKISKINGKPLILLRIDSGIFLILDDLEQAEPTIKAEISIKEDSKTIIDYALLNLEKNNSYVFLTLFQDGSIEITKGNFNNNSSEQKMINNLEIEKDEQATGLHVYNTKSALITTYHPVKEYTKIFRVTFSEEEVNEVKLQKQFHSPLLENCILSNSSIFGVSEGKGFFIDVASEDGGGFLDFGEKVQDYQLVESNNTELWVLGVDGSVRRFE